MTLFLPFLNAAYKLEKYGFQVTIITLSYNYLYQNPDRRLFVMIPMIPLWYSVVLLFCSANYDLKQSEDL